MDGRVVPSGFTEITSPIWMKPSRDRSRIDRSLSRAVVSQIRATPSWVLVCTALTIGLFVLTYWLGDLRQKAHWFRIIKPAGTDTLLCYLIPYFAYAILTMTGVFALEALSGWVGILKSLLFSILMIQIAGLLGKAGIRLKL